MSHRTPTRSTASVRQQTPANTPATNVFHLHLVHLFCSIRSRFLFQTHLRLEPNNDQQAILATIPFSSNATYIIAFLQPCALHSQDFAICHRECIEFENPDRCGSAFSPDSVRKISCLFNAINAVKTLFLSILDFTRNGIKHTNTYSQSRVHAACKQTTTIHDMMKLQYCRIRMFHDSTTCRGFNTSETLTMTYTIHPMHSAFIKIPTRTCT